MEGTRHIAMALIFCGLITGCIDQFNFQSEQEKKNLVVDGKITQKDVPHELNLSYSQSVGSFNMFPVSKAIVKLYDDEGNYEQYYETTEGKYMFYGYVLNIEPGVSYYLEILTAQNKLYRSHPQVMPESIQPDRLHFDFEYIEDLNDAGIPVTRKYINLYLDTPIKRAGRDFHFIWRADEAYAFSELFCSPLVPPKVCYIQRKLKPDDIVLFSSEGLSGEYLTDFEILSKELSPVWEFYEKHFFNVRQYSIPWEAYEYWSTLKKVAQPTGSIFDTPPAPIKGNVYNVDDLEEVVLGFFEVSAVDTIRTYTFRQDLEPLIVYDRCPEYGRRYYDPVCCQCLELPDSYVERPYYWDQTER